MGAVNAAEPGRPLEVQASVSHSGCGLEPVPLEIAMCAKEWT